MIRLKNPPLRVRRYLYRISLAGVALLVGYGWLTAENALLWVALFGPVLGLADLNAKD